jgi:DNA primase catalytic subunit
MESSKEIVSLDVRKQIDQYKDKTKQVLEMVKELEICSKDQAERAVDIAVEAVNLKEKIEATKDDLLSPSKRFIAEISKLADEFTDSLDEVKTKVVENIDAWKFITGEGKNLRTSLATAYDTEEVLFDVQDLSEIPMEYLMVDKAKVKLAMKQGARVIPGLAIRKNSKTILRRVS